MQKVEFELEVGCGILPLWKHFISFAVTSPSVEDSGVGEIRYAIFGDRV